MFHESQHSGFAVGNDILAMTYDVISETKQALDSVARKRCQNMQVDILTNYNFLRAALRENHTLSSALQTPGIKQTLEIFFENKDIFSIRHWVLTELTYEVWCKIRRHRLIVCLLQFEKTNHPLVSEILEQFSEDSSHDEMLDFFEKNPRHLAFFIDKIGCMPGRIPFAKGQVSGEMEAFFIKKYHQDISQTLKDTVIKVTGEATIRLLKNLYDLSKPGIYASHIDGVSIQNQHICLDGQRIKLSKFLCGSSGKEYQKKDIDEQADLLNDRSWLPEGEKNLKLQSKLLHRAASTIQHAYRFYKKKKSAERVFNSLEEPDPILKAIRF